MFLKVILYMLKVVNTLFRTYIGRYGRELRMHYDDPLELQREVLDHILKANRSTAFGREHGFYGLIKSPEAFSERVPVRTYEQHLPYLERILNGEKRVLTHEEADYVSTTSGTTGATKYLPLSHNAISDIHLKGSWMSLACLYAKDPDHGLVCHRGIYRRSSSTLSHASCVVFISPTSTWLLR